MGHSILDQNSRVDVINSPDRSHGEVYTHHAHRKVSLGGINVNLEGWVFAVGAGHNRAVALHLKQHGEDLLPQGIARAFIVQEADVLVGDGLDLTHGLVSSPLDVNLAAIRQQPLDDDSAQIAL